MENEAWVTGPGYEARWRMRHGEWGLGMRLDGNGAWV